MPDGNVRPDGDIKTALAISSEVGVGAVGLSIARFAFARQKVEAICLPSIILASRPDLGTMAGHIIPAPALSLHLDGLEKDGWFERLDGVMTGYFASVEQVNVVADNLKKLRRINPAVTVLVDPVLGDVDTGLYVPEDVALAVRDLLVPLADIITPNLFEFSWLCGNNLTANLLEVNEFLEACSSLAVPSIVVTSAVIEAAGHSGSDLNPKDACIKTALLHEGQLTVFNSPYMQMMPKGTGDVFAAHLLAGKMKGAALDVAVLASVEFLEEIAQKAHGRETIAPSMIF